MVLAQLRQLARSVLGIQEEVEEARVFRVARQIDDRSRALTTH